MGSSGDKVYEWTLSTANSIVSISGGDTLSVSSEDFLPTDMWFKSDGTELYVVGSANDLVHKYDMTTGWDLSTATFSRPTTEVFDVSSEDTSPRGIHFKDDGTKMFVVGRTGDEVNEYHLSTAWDITTASYDSRLYVGSQEAIPIGIHFKPDGTKMYIVGESGDEVNQWNLSTAWDISTATFFTNMSVSTQDARPRGIFFEDDGTTMYVLGSNSDTVYQYNVTVAWNAGYASYANKSFSLSGIESNPYGLFFDSDGTRMYVGSGSGRVTEIGLSTAWDVSTGSHTHTFVGTAAANSALGIAFKPDGTKFYVTDNDNNEVVAFTIS
jgi:DNA-binding beta-propeller fold protein YncE